MIYPDDKLKAMYWDVLVSIILLMTCFLTPLNLAFSDELDSIQWYYIMNMTIDFLFLIDIFVNFNTAFQRENNIMCDTRCDVVKNYATGWFIIDLLAIFPFEIIVKFSESRNQESNSSDPDFNEMVRITRVSKLYKLVRVTRLLRLVKLFKKGNKAT